MNDFNKTTRPLLKICGVTRPEDVGTCERYGVDFIGLNFFAGSPRFVDLCQARELVAVTQRCTVVGVSVDAQLDDLQRLSACLPQLSVWQLHGNESIRDVSELQNRTGCRVWKALKIAKREDIAHVQTWVNHVELILLDGATPGSGEAFAWDWLDDISVPAVWGLAGGLNPDNLPQALDCARPALVDIASGVETRLGIKDAKKISQSVRIVRGSQG